MRSRVQSPAVVLFFPLLLAMLSLLATTVPSAARAAGSFGNGRFSLDDANPEASIPPVAEQNAHPLDFGYFLQDLLDRAATASKRGDQAAAVRYYRAVVKAVPDRAIGHSRLCQALEAVHQREAALTACRSALGLSGVVVDDYVRFVRLTLAAPGPLPPKDVDDVKAIVEHLRGQMDTKTTADDLQCQLGVHQGDVVALEQCTTGLAAARPADPRTISYQWALAVQKGDDGEARRLVQRAASVGMPAPAVALLQQQTDARFSGGWSQRLGDWHFTVPLLVAVLAAGASLLTASRRRRGSQQQRPA